MTAAELVDLQEALVYFFAPVLQYLLMVFVAGGVLSGIGALILSIASRMSR